MNITKRAISVGMSAALLASLVATVAAPAAFAAAASVTPSGTGTFPQGSFEAGVYSSATSYTFNEGSANGWGDATVLWPVGAGFTLDIIINTPYVYFDTTHAPTISAPATLSMTGAFISNTDYRLTAGSSDKTLQEAFTVSGLMVAAKKNAPLGPVDTRYIFNNGAPVALFGGNTKTISGTLATALSAGVDGWALVNLNAGSDLFNNASVTYPWVFNGGASNEEDINSGTAYGPVACPDTTCTGGQQELYLNGGTFGQNHAVGEPVTQQEPVVGDPILPSLGTVVAAASLSALTPTSVLPGENNQDFATTSICENNSGDFAAAAVVTAKVLTSGALFSQAPTAGTSSNGGAGSLLTLVNSTASLSFDRTTATWVVSSADTGTKKTCINIGGFYDIAISAAPGTSIKMSVTVGSLTSIPASVTNAIVGSNIYGTALSVPTVFIGQNAQSVATIKITESAAGTWQSGPGANTLKICIEVGNGPTPSFTRAPWAVVGAGTDLLLRDPVSLTGKTQVLGQADGSSCYSWSIYQSSSTAPASIYLVGSDASGNPLPITGVANGPQINVPYGAAPGQITFDLRDGDNLSTVSFGNLVVAIAAYANSPAVTVGTPVPYIQPGGVNQPGSKITISETAPGQFNADEIITATVLPNSKTNNQEQYFTGGSGGVYTTAFTVSTNSNSGLAAHIVDVTSTSISICIDQRAFQPTLGVLTIDGFRYSTVADATLGPVLLEVTGYMPVDSEGCDIAWGQIGPQSPRAFDTFVSNATVGSAPVPQTVVMTADSSLSASGPFTYATKILKPGQSITIRVRTNPQLAGVRLGVWIAIKGANGTWGAYKPHTSVTTDVNGTAYYTYTFGSKAWLAFRFYYGGDATHAPAWSYPSQFGRAM